MTKNMLIDASHAEETRVVVLDNNRLDDFDLETADKKQIKGNIYLAKVIRVEPSLQAAFVEYGGNRHGFLAFAEIHPDYYQIPVADRQKLLEIEAEEARRRVEAEDAEDAAAETARPLQAARPPQVTEIAIEDAPPPADSHDDAVEQAEPSRVAGGAAAPAGAADEDGLVGEAADGEAAGGDVAAAAPEQLGGDDGAEEARERRKMRALRSYKIQEVIHRRQILLIQVVKEERGSKGAALTTYISLAGRFSVLMPNSPNGGGVSRKITSIADRRRLKEAMSELDIPEGMGMIVRTAGANRPKPEIKRDCEYLLRLWDDIRERTLSSIAPALVYEEASLIKRTIRDVYTRDVDQVLIEGEEGFRTAREFMRMLMPTHVKKVLQWTERQPLFAKHNVEQMLDQMFQPTVQLKSGGYLVLNQTEALVAIDVNSGRSTRERNIEDTALRTNMEAAEEVARQLRLRDLAGLIVVDFIDMETRKHNVMVERKLKEALKNDRARIQVGSISHFGLLEMSRQRLRPSISETMLIPCPHCEGVGHVRSTASTALAVLRAIEDEAARQAAEISVHLAPEVALYIFNHKRAQLAATEARYGVSVRFVADGAVASAFKVEKVRAHPASRAPEAEAVIHGHRAERVIEAEPEETEAEEIAEGRAGSPAEEAGVEAGAQTGAETESGAAEAGSRATEDGERRRRRRRRRRGGRRDDTAPAPGAEQPEMSEMPAEFEARMNASVPGAMQTAPDIETPAELVVAEVKTAEETTAETPEIATTEVVAPEAEVPEAEAPEAPEAAASAAVAEKPKRRPSRSRTAPKSEKAAKTEAAPKATPTRRKRAAAKEVKPDEPVFTDIADIFEAAERAEAAAPKPRRTRSTKTASRPRKAAAAADAPETVESAAGSAEFVAPAPETPAMTAPAHGTAEATDDGAAVAGGETGSEAGQARAGGAQPKVIGESETPPTARKRGWWKRPA